MRVDRMRDLLERVGWTAIEAASAAGITVLTGTMIGWTAAVKFVAIATGLAVLKVIVAQRMGSNEDGAAIPGGIRAKSKTPETM